MLVCLTFTMHVDHLCKGTFGTASYKNSTSDEIESSITKGDAISTVMQAQGQLLFKSESKIAKAIKIEGYEVYECKSWCRIHGCSAPEL